MRVPLKITAHPRQHRFLKLRRQNLMIRRSDAGKVQMQNPELARKRRLMASDIGTRKNTVKLISRRLVVIGF